MIHNAQPRITNFSIVSGFTHIEELSNLEGTNMSLELSKRYTALEAYINQLKDLDNHQ